MSYKMKDEGQIEDILKTYAENYKKRHGCEFDWYMLYSRLWALLETKEQENFESVFGTMKTEDLRNTIGSVSAKVPVLAQQPAVLGACVQEVVNSVVDNDSQLQPMKVKNNKKSKKQD